MDWALVAAGLGLLAWTVHRSQSGRSPFGPSPDGDLPDTGGATLLAIALWLVAPIVAFILLRPPPGSVQPGVMLTAKTLELLIALGLLRVALGGTRRRVVSRPRLAALACAAGLVTFALAGLTTEAVLRGYLLAGAARPSQQIADLVGSSSGPGLAALVLTAVVVTPLAEEVLFRGLLFPALARGLPTRAALLLQALLFGFVHFWGDPSKWALALPIAVVGYCAGWLYHRTGSLWAAVGLHAVYNAIQVGFLVSGAPS